MSDLITRHPVTCSLSALMSTAMGLDFPELSDPGVLDRSHRAEKVFRDWYDNRDEDDKTPTKHLVIAPRASCKTTVEQIGLSAFIRLRDGGLKVGSPRSEIGSLKFDSMMEYLDLHDVMLMVDPVTFEDTLYMMDWQEKSWDLYQKALKGLERNGLLILVTCRLHEDDLAGQILKKERDEWSVHTTTASDYPTIWPQDKVDRVMSTESGRAQAIQLGVPR